MKLHEVKSEPQNRRMSNIECRRMEYIPSTFDIHYSTFDILFFKISLSIGMAARG